MFAVIAAAMVMTLVAGSLMTAATPAYAIHQSSENQGDCVSTNVHLDKALGSTKETKKTFQGLCQEAYKGNDGVVGAP